MDKIPAYYSKLRRMGFWLNIIISLLSILYFIFMLSHMTEFLIVTKVALMLNLVGFGIYYWKILPRKPYMVVASGLLFLLLTVSVLLDMHLIPILGN